MGRAFLIIHFCSFACLIGPVVAAGEQDTAGKQLQKLEDDSRSRAEAIQVNETVGKKAVKATVLPEPPMKYTDVPRGIEMATLWVWQEDGRPVAIGKVEAYREKEETKWLHCFASASTGLVDAKWTDGHLFQAKKPGVEWVTLKGPAPQDTAAGRLRQMKEIFQRFAATTHDDLLKTSFDLRHLARQLHEYSSPKNGVTQGILCGFAANGTNPDVVVALEAVTDNTGGKSWRYSVIGMTALGITVKLDKTEVYKRAYAKSPEDFETWTYFWEGEARK
jgi:hypothetical protein